MVAARRSAAQLRAAEPYLMFPKSMAELSDH